MKKINYIILITFILLSALSCELITDVDDAKPYFKQEESSVYNSIKGIDANVNGMYQATRHDDIGYYAQYSGEMAGLYMPFEETPSSRVMLTVNDPHTAGIYQAWYSLITKANYLIKNLSNLKENQIEGLTEERRTEIIGEAKIARAIGHFQLLKIFGQHYDINSQYGIPVVLDIIEEGPKRNTVKEVYDAIYKDLQEAMTEAPMMVDRQRFTQSTAKAYMAKVALFKNDYATAAQYAKEIIDAGEYTLEPMFTDIFSNSFNSTEVIFAPYSKIQSEDINVPNELTEVSSLSLMMLADSQIPGEQGDDMSGAGYDPRYAAIHAFGYRMLGLFLIPNGKFIKNYTGFEGEAGNTHYYMRLPELYFIYAEAKARLAKDAPTNPDFMEAVSHVNMIRARVGLPDIAPADKYELLDQIRTEKTMEFMLEWGQPWLDMVRYHFLGDIDIKMLLPSVKNDWQLIYPFNAKTLNGNPNLEQNPGYAK